MLTAMVISAVTASPIVSFTRGAAGAIFASDIVALTVLIVLVLHIRRNMFRERPPAWYRWLVGLVVVAIVSSIVIAPYHMEAMSGGTYAGRVSAIGLPIPVEVQVLVFRIFKIGLYLVFGYVVAKMSYGESEMAFVSRVGVLCIIAIALARLTMFWTGVDFALYYPDALHDYGRVLGHSKNASSRLYVLGIFLTIMLSKSARLRPLFWVGLPFFLISIYVSGSRAALVALVVGLAALAIFARLRGGALVIVTAGIGVIVMPLMIDLSPDRFQQFAILLNDPTTNSRMEIWAWVVNYLMSQPLVVLTGVGFNNFSYAMAGDGGMAEHAHLDLLNVLVEVGMPGVIFFVGYVGSLLYVITKVYVRGARSMRWSASCVLAALCGLVVASIFEPTFYYSSSAVPMQRFIIILIGGWSVVWLRTQRSIYRETSLRRAAEVFHRSARQINASGL